MPEPRADRGTAADSAEIPANVILQWEIVDYATMTKKNAPSGTCRPQ